MFDVVEDDEYVQFSVHSTLTILQWTIQCPGSLIIIVLTKPSKGYEHPEKTDPFWLSYPPTILGRSFADLESFVRGGPILMFFLCVFF